MLAEESWAHVSPVLAEIAQALARRQPELTTPERGTMTKGGNPSPSGGYSRSGFVGAGV